MKNKKILISILSGLLAILLVIIAVCGVMVIRADDNVSTPYQKNIDLGNKYLESGDYEQAIAYYRAAISNDPTQDGPYYQLATMYIRLSRLTEAKEVLEEGIQKTSSQRLIDLYNMYFNTVEINDINSPDDPEDSSDDKPRTQEEVYFNSGVFDIMANYTFENYNVQYSNMNISNANDIYTIKVPGFNASLYFYNESPDLLSIDTDKNAPYDKVRPNYIVLDTLEDIITGVEKAPVSTDGLYSMGATRVDIMYDAELERSVQFTYRNCIVKIALDANDCITATAKHKIVSEFGTGADQLNLVKTYEGTIKVVDATNAQGIANAKANVRALNDHTGEILFEATTQANGEFTVSLEEGKYTVEIICEDYVTEYVDFEVYSTGVFSIDQVTISPELAAGQMRIVLEWQDWPLDLDSYYLDNEGNGIVSYRNRQFYDNGELVAELDVDDRDGFGPETITVYDMERDFTYAIVDFNNTVNLYEMDNITIKVYMADEAPIVFHTNVSSTLSDNAMMVFEYVDGQIRFLGEPAETQSASAK